MAGRTEDVELPVADLQILRDKPDGVLGPMTRNAIRDFQRSAGLRATGEPSKEVYFALRQALMQRDVATRSPLPLPPKQEPAAPVAIDVAKLGPDAWPPDGTDQVKAITGHRSLATVRRYIREGSLFRDNPAGKLGL